MIIRPAEESDALGVAQVHVQTWQTAYRGLVPDEYLDALSVEKRKIAWSETIRKQTPELWISESNSVLTGWVAFGPSRDAAAAPSTAELEAIYVMPAYWGTGTGRGLWLAARKRLVERQFARATLWVLTQNVRAIRFYAAAGFQPDPASQKQIAIGGAALTEIRYEAPLRAAKAPILNGH